MITFKLSWAGMGYHVYTWNNSLNLRVQVSPPSDYFIKPDDGGRIWFARNVWPWQVPAAGTVTLDLFSSDGPPPAEALTELWEEIVRGYLDHLEWANARDLPARRVPVRPVPAWFDPKREMFVTADGRPAYGLRDPTP